MLNINSKKHNAKAFINLLKSSIPVVVYDEVNNFAYSMLATEFLEEDFQSRDINNANLLVTKEKFNFYTNNNSNKDISIEFTSKNQLFTISNGDFSSIENYKEANNLEALLLSFVKKFEIIPELLISLKKFDSFADFKKWAFENNLFYITSEDLEKYSKTNQQVKEITRTNLKLTEKCINAEFIVYEDNYKKQHYAIIIGNLKNFKTPLVRIHSSCYTGDLLASLSCDCRDQLHYAINHISEDNEGGIIIYLSQEGRGIGLANKIKAYNLQSKSNLDTTEANLALGFNADERDFKISALILKKLHINSIKLITNNPSKVSSLKEHAINVKEVINLHIKQNQYNSKYIKTKHEKLGHVFKQHI